MVASRSSKEFKKGQLKQADVNLVRKEVNIHELTLDELRIEVTLIYFMLLCVKIKQSNF